MKYSNLFGQSKKSSKEYDSINATLLEKGGFIEQAMSGVYSFLPLGLRVIRKIEDIIRDEMEKLGGQEIFMPALQPKESWEKTERWETLDILFKLKGAGDKEYALGPTHEEIVTPLVKNHVFSYKELPVALYQIQSKFRNELRAKSGLLRGREFLMKDLYSFHENKECLEGFYAEAQKAYHKIFERLGIGDLTFITYASGGSFSRYSHEYQAICEVGEDTIYLCKDCEVAVNEEIIKKQSECPECGKDDFQKLNAIEVGNIFKLGTKFSKAFSLTYTNEKGEEKLMEMGCYGIGVPRVMGAVVEVSHDESGIIWPESIAPFRVYLFSIGEEKEVKTKTKEVYTKLQKAGVEVLFDDRDASAGEKFANADLLGIPYRVVVSGKTLKKDGVEVKKRGEEKEVLKDEKEMIKEIED